MSEIKEIAALKELGVFSIKNPDIISIESSELNEKSFDVSFIDNYKVIVEYSTELLEYTDSADTALKHPDEVRKEITKISEKYFERIVGKSGTNSEDEDYKVISNYFIVRKNKSPSTIYTPYSYLSLSPNNVSNEKVSKVKILGISEVTSLRQKLHSFNVEEYVLNRFQSLSDRVFDLDRLNKFDKKSDHFSTPEEYKNYRTVTKMLFSDLTDLVLHNLLNRASKYIADYELNAKSYLITCLQYHRSELK